MKRKGHPASVTLEEDVPRGGQNISKFENLVVTSAENTQTRGQLV